MADFSKRWEQEDYDDFWQRVHDFYQEHPDMDSLQNPDYWNGLDAALARLVQGVERLGESNRLAENANENERRAVQRELSEALRARSDIRKRCETEKEERRAEGQ
jgi:hypothetical protein